jgi:hypothetical protein
MAKKHLNHLSNYIATQIKESSNYRKEKSNLKTHRFTLTSEILYEEMSKQLAEVKKYARVNGKRASNSTFNSELSTICNAAVPIILRKVGALSTAYDITWVDSNTIEIRPKKHNQDVFNFIKARYRPEFTETVTNKIIDQLFSKFNSTKKYDSLMRGTDAAYDSYENSSDPYERKIYELNSALIGAPSRINKDIPELGYRRRGGDPDNNIPGTIQVSGGSGNLGHLISVAEQRADDILTDISNQLEAIETPDMGYITSYFRDMPDIAITILKEVKFRRNEIVSKGLNQNFTVVMTTIHSSKDNQSRGASEDKRILDTLAPELEKAIKKHDWANQKGSKSYVDNALTVLAYSSIHTLTKGKRGKLKKSSLPKGDGPSTSKGAGVAKSSGQKQPHKRITGRGAKSKIKTPKAAKGSPPTLQAGPRKTNWLQLLPLINAKLTDQVMRNMKSPRLNNRTGRFAQSAKVINVEQTRQGFPSFVFDYERDPYDVFDRTLGRAPWNTPQRDPRALVDTSVREIVREMAIGRFFTRRA